MGKLGGAWADVYRKKWTWDKVTWGSHAVDCYPGGCSWRVFTRNGRVVREEQAGLASPVEQGIPDMNPMGCQKGACWSHCIYSQDRVTRPLKRVGERGEGKFEPVSWDAALGDIADAMLLGGLLAALFRRGVVLVATSNLAPGSLYRDGLQRARFLPAIDLLERHTRVVELAGDIDFRLRILERSEIYHSPLDDGSERALEHAFERFSGGYEMAATLQINGRPFRARRRADGVVWFDFAELCGKIGRAHV